MTNLPRSTPHSSSDSLTQELTALHERYIEAVNAAVAADDLALVDELARDFDRDALDLMSERLHGHAA